MRTNLILLALVVSVGSSSAASASPSIVLHGQSFPVTFTAQNGTGRLETVGGLSIVCSKETAQGEITSATLGTASDDITECKEGKVGCRSEKLNEKKELVKDPAETILLDNLHGSLITLSGSTAGVANTLSETLKVLCGTAKAEVRGSTIGVLSPVKKETKTASLVSTQSKGKRTTGSCVEEKGICEKLAGEPLEAKIGAKFEEAATELSGTVTFSKMVEIIA